MGERWTVERVVALAPDASSAAAGRKLAASAAWVDAGHVARQRRDIDAGRAVEPGAAGDAGGPGAAGDAGGPGAAGDAGGPGAAERPEALFGLCQGSGAAPYQVVVDLDGPASRCTCPSRKFPCKHAIALLLRWAEGHVPSVATPSDYALTWLDTRAAKAPRESGPPDLEAAAARAKLRAERVTSGLRELNRWLEDQVRSGLAGTEHDWGHFEPPAARLVDAQAPGLAAWLRRLPGVVHSGPGWPGRLLAEYGLISLLIHGHDQLAELPAPLAATVRQRVGYPVTKESVLATAPVADRWSVLGLKDTEEDRLTSRRVWLQGNRTHRPAMVLTFTPSGQTPDGSLVVGTSLDADLHFYPGAAPLRALVGTRHGNLDEALPPHGADVVSARAAVADVLAQDPWTTSWPLVLRNVTLSGADGSWNLSDATGSLPLRPGPDAPWLLAAVAGGRPSDVLVEWTPEGLTLLSALGDRLVPL